MNFDSVLTTSRKGWVGSGGLWVQLPPGGVLVTIPNPVTHRLRTKFGWFRAVPGQVRVTAAPYPPGRTQAAFHSEVGTVPEYGPTGFTPSGLEFGSPGCWKITGTLGGARLAVVLDVRPG